MTSVWHRGAERGRQSNGERKDISHVRLYQPFIVSALIFVHCNLILKYTEVVQYWYMAAEVGYNSLKDLCVCDTSAS